MILVRRPLNDGDYLLVGIFPAVEVRRLLDIVDEHTDPGYLEYAVIDNGGLILDCCKDSLFSEIQNGSKDEEEGGEGDYFEPDIRISGIGEQISDLMYHPEQHNWYSLRRAMLVGIGEEDEEGIVAKPFTQSEEFLESVGSQEEKILAAEEGVSVEDFRKTLYQGRKEVFCPIMGITSVIERIMT